MRRSCIYITKPGHTEELLEPKHLLLPTQVDGYVPFLSLFSYILVAARFKDSNMKVLGDSKVTERFQTTIPVTVRRHLRVDPGDRLVFMLDEDNVLVKKGKVEIQSR